MNLKTFQLLYAKEFLDLLQAIACRLVSLKLQSV